jgi:hypothetical protein
MGQSLQEGNPFEVITNKPVEHLLQNAVWFIQGDGAVPKSYSLASVFLVSEVGETGEREFKRFARGRGHLFQPPVPLNDLEWFKDFFKRMAHFSIGVQAIKEERFVEGLLHFAAEAGYRLGPRE